VGINRELKQDDAMRVGSGVSDITPDIGVPLSGFAIRRNKPSVAIDDPLCVKAIAIENCESFYLLLSYDLLSFDRKVHIYLEDKLRKELKDRFISDHIVITTTHTHSGPPTSGISGEDSIPSEYKCHLGEATISAVRKAIKNLDEASLFHFNTKLKNVTINRRYELWEKTKGEGLSNPDHKSYVDDTFNLYIFKNNEGNNLASFVRFACHGVTMMTQHISADFPGELTRRLSKILGIPCLFLQGAAGDVNPTVVSKDHAAMLGFVDNLIEQIGNFIEHLKKLPFTTIESVEAFVTLEYATFPPRNSLIETIEKHERISAGDLTSQELQDLVQMYSEWRYPNDKDIVLNVRHWGGVFKDVYSRTLSAIDNPELFPPPPLRIVIWRLDSFRIIFLAGEVLTSVGEHIKAIQPNQDLQVVSFLSPIVGYISDSDDYKIGGYEPKSAWSWYRLPGPFKEDTEMGILKKITELLSTFNSSGY
jgi:hypothetical protein